MSWLCLWCSMVDHQAISLHYVSCLDELVLLINILLILKEEICISRVAAITYMPSFSSIWSTNRYGEHLSPLIKDLILLRIQLLNTNTMDTYSSYFLFKAPFPLVICFTSVLRKFPLRNCGVPRVILWAYPSLWRELKDPQLLWLAGWWHSKKDPLLTGKSSESTLIFPTHQWRPPQHTLLQEPPQVNWLYIESASKKRTSILQWIQYEKEIVGRFTT